MMEHPSVAGIRIVLNQLKQALDSIDNSEYTESLEILSGATLGQHTRHITDMFQRLLLGYDTGAVNYDRRERSPIIESDRHSAVDLIHQISESVVKSEKELHLICENPSGSFQLQTSYNRELHYCLEHTVHHLAIMKVGFKQLGNTNLPENFGVAFSTIAYKAASS